MTLDISQVGYKAILKRYYHVVTFICKIQKLYNGNIEKIICLHSQMKALIIYYNFFPLISKEIVSSSNIFERFLRY